MSEAASWFATAHPLEWLGSLRRRFRLRKVRLFLAACLEQGDPDRIDERWRGFLDATDLYEQGSLPETDYARVCDKFSTMELTVQASQLALAAASAEMLRDLFGSPMPSEELEPAWLAWNDRAVVRIAQRIHAERSFGEMPILADALEEAGCTSGVLLSHARGPGPHFRGCWLLELILEQCPKQA